MQKNTLVIASYTVLLLVLLAACSQVTSTPSQQISPLSLSWHIQTIDSPGTVGEYSSLALDGLGNPVISYFAADAGDLKLVRCGNADCSSGNSLQLVDIPGLVGVQSSLALDSSGNPVISYLDGGDGNLKLVHCGSVDCSIGNSIQTIDTGGARIRVVGLYSSLVLDSLGNPVISYHDASNNDLKLVHCGNADCSTGNSIQVVDSIGDVGLHTSLVLDSLGNPVISYFDNTNFDLKLVQCGNADCSFGNSIQTVDSTGAIGRYTSLKLNASGNPVISYSDFTNRDLKLVQCGNSDCSSLNTFTSVDSTGDVGSFTSLELSSLGNPVVAYSDDTNHTIKLVQCGDSNCSSNNSFTSVDNVVLPLRGEHISLDLDSFDNPVISYYDALNTDLKLARLVETSGDITPPIISATVTGTLGNNDWYTSDVSVSWTITDNESAISSSPCDSTVVSADTARVAIACTATSSGGTASQSVVIKRDATAPALNPVVSPNPVFLQASASAVSNASDALSGLASESCEPVNTATVGAKSVSCSATDQAGNTSSASANYQVIYNFSGFFGPVDNLPVFNEVNADRAIPVRFSLAGNQGLEILTASSQTISCVPNAVIDRIEQTVNATNSRLSYNASTNTYTYVWKTSKSWAKTCRQLVLTLNDGTQHLANFKLR
jgi:hypothetical protein